jgi:hypothetical protein
MTFSSSLSSSNSGILNPTLFDKSVTVLNIFSNNFLELSNSNCLASVNEP